jgi:hypothetical protein
MTQAASIDPGSPDIAKDAQVVFTWLHDIINTIFTAARLMLYC